MRKCVSMVAAATAAVGLAGCSSPDRTREPAGAARPLSPAPSPDPAAAAGNAGPLPALGVAVPAPAGGRPAPAAGNQPLAGVQRAPDGTTEDVAGSSPDSPGSPAAANPVAPNPAAANPAGISVNPGGPALAPSGTTPMSPSAHSASGHAAPPKAAPAKTSTIPPAALPAPAPPAAGIAGTDSQPSAMAQLVESMAAAQIDGKPVLLDFSTGDSAESRALDAALRAPQSRAVLARSYHVVRVDLGSGDPGLLKMASQYAFGASGMPLLVVLSPDGTVRADSIHNGRPRLDDAGVAAWLRQWAR